MSKEVKASAENQSDVLKVVQGGFRSLISKAVF